MQRRIKTHSGAGRTDRFESLARNKSAHSMHEHARCNSARTHLLDLSREISECPNYVYLELSILRRPKFNRPAVVGRQLLLQPLTAVGQLTDARLGFGCAFERVRD